MKEKELKKIIRLHELWLRTKGKKGKGANLDGADLKGATLWGVTLC
jgi:uncharacterized protein YjbI with pentapeptide repeats